MQSHKRLRIKICWTETCHQAFSTLKEKLVKPPVLWYPQFHSSASQFVVHTDKLGATLQLDNHVVAYTNCVDTNTVWYRRNVCLLYMLQNNLGNTYLADSFSFIQIMHTAVFVSTMLGGLIVLMGIKIRVSL